MASIEILLDATSDAAVREEWRLLAVAGLPSQHTHAGESNAPHVTAAYSTGVPPALSVRIPAGPLALGAPVLFRRRRGVVLARMVVVTRALLDWHASLHEGLPVDLETDVNTRPDGWTPHVTLSRNLPLESLQAALTVLDLSPIVATATAVRLWDPTTRTVTLLN
ncbi:2'-5' RNA ligase family protein [Amnibacterium flavum]|uniref:2'-5' RNA ligase n=1 Tax=Amnibacterium flavum TaxID=2173173 RepID=A0A2V1HNE2_9MICO|nr:2'-5' RNA ligase family protein [Amnibacterium flavum]PVZ94068.1 hypothetical protein DDQ50_09960 [Amnibacterium flavum]